ncbi:hypothetical protein LguiA_008080 [Lonicera macranthoides]
MNVIRQKKRERHYLGDPLRQEGVLDMLSGDDFFRTLLWRRLLPYRTYVFNGAALGKDVAENFAAISPIMRLFR